MDNIFKENFKENFTSLDLPIIKQVTEMKDNIEKDIKKNINETDMEKCKPDADKILNSGMVDTITKNITSTIVGYLNGNNDMECFKKRIENIKPSIIKEINNKELKYNNKKKSIYSKIIDLDIRKEYLKTLDITEKNLDKLNNADLENSDNDDNNKSLSKKQKKNINKRLIFYYDKNIDFLKIIYNILYYIYISLFLLYLLFLIFNIYLQATKIDNDFSKIKKLSICIILISILPLILKYIVNKYIKF